MRKILFLVLLMFILAGCDDWSDLLPPKDVNHTLSVNCKSILKQGDTLLYKSNYSNLARYCVMKRITGYFWVSISKKDGEQSRPWEMWDYEAVLIDSVGKTMTQDQKKTLNRASNIEYPIWIYSDNSNYPDFISIRNFARGSSFAGTGAVSARWYNSITKNYQKSSSLKILNREFKNVVYSDLDPNSNTTSVRQVVTFYCNSTNGLLGFKFSDGEIFELVE